MKSILVTGCAGFIGSNFVPYFLEKHPEYHIINLDLLTYAGDLENLEEIKDNEHYTFVKGDICDRELVESLFSTYDIRGVIHFAAESHVDNSIKNPGVFIETNVNGTFTLINVAYKYWMENPLSIKQGMKNADSIIFQQMKFTGHWERKDFLLKKHLMHQIHLILPLKLGVI